MRLSRIRVGDVVLVDDGLPYMALVVDKEPRRLRVRALGSHRVPKPVKPGEVQAYWRLAAGDIGDLVVRYSLYPRGAETRAREAAVS